MRWIGRLSCVDLLLLPVPVMAQSTGDSFGDEQNDPNLQKIDASWLVGRVLCGHCGGPYARELVSCPPCGAPPPDPHGAS